MIDYTNAIRQEVQESLKEIRSNHKDDVSKVRDAISLLERIFEQLRTFIRGYLFKDEQEEILFFKEIKPNLFSRLIYCQKLYKLLVNRPPGGEDEQRDYLNTEMKYLFLFFEKHKEFYHYYRSGETHQDTAYYLRGRPNLHVSFESFYYERDPLFSTACDFKLAKLKANEEYEKIIVRELEKISGKNTVEKISSFLKLKWTGTKSQLTELIYALHETRCINNGSLSLNELKKKFEFIFDIDLGEIHRTLRDISLRQNPTQFMDKLKSAVNAIIDRILK